MPEDIIPDPTDPGTRRPKAPLLTAKGNSFKPMKLNYFTTEIYFPEYASPNDPISFLILYYSLEIIEYIIQMTNLSSRTPRDLSGVKPHNASAMPRLSTNPLIFFTRCNLRPRTIIPEAVSFHRLLRSLDSVYIRS